MFIVFIFFLIYGVEVYFKVGCLFLLVNYSENEFVSVSQPYVPVFWNVFFTYRFVVAF